MSFKGLTMLEVNKKMGRSSNRVENRDKKSNEFIDLEKYEHNEEMLNYWEKPNSDINIEEMPETWD